MPGPDTVASVRDLTVSLRRRGARSPVLRGIDLDIAPGEIVGLVGESGSGKSVLAMTMLGLLPRSSRPEITGSVHVAGTDILHGSAAQLRAARRTRLGVIFQDPMTSLNPTMRIGKQITELTGDNGEAISLLSAVGVPEPRKRMRAFPHELSGGLRQRVMAAIALTGRPQLIVADEPTTALDVTVQAQLLALLADLRAQFGCSVLFITHDLAVAAQLTDRIAVLYQGRVAELGPTAQLLDRPAHPYTAGLLGSRLSLSTPRRDSLPTLPGDSAPVTDRLHGCAYHTRCPLVLDRCRIDQPPLEPAGDGRTRACWRDTAEVHDVVVPADGLAAPLAPSSAESADTVIKVRDLACEFRTRSGFGPKHTVHALRGVDLDVRAGEALSIVGESGSGKSTLLRVLAGLTNATSGTAVLRGTAQMVFQDAGSSLTPWLTVGELLRERLRGAGAGSGDRIRAILATMGLPETVLDARPGELSGGQRQRVALARAVVVPPTVLLCDEPTSALDASLAASVLNLIREMRRELAMTVVFVTHDLAVARLMGDRIAVMAQGQLVEIGDADDLVTAPTDPRTRALLDAVPRIDSTEVLR
ncbi:ABC transporter ATP-binding protein [Amycolatopsis sp. NPDC049253]|uniref:ABC transporter ATP-binding protein n=1 Tax=Amycolatopsis sp. NPDC049253 TaxID=3155274 RepID=UPI00342A84FE